LDLEEIPVVNDFSIEVSFEDAVSVDLEPALKINPITKTAR